jgi:hypothetical protein
MKTSIDILLENLPASVPTSCNENCVNLRQNNIHDFRTVPLTSAILFQCCVGRKLTLALDGGGWSTPRPGRFTPQKEPRYPLYRRLGGHQGCSGWVQKNLAPTGIRFPDRPSRSESLYRLSCRGRSLVEMQMQLRHACF